MVAGLVLANCQESESHFMRITIDAWATQRVHAMSHCLHGKRLYRTSGT